MKLKHQIRRLLRVYGHHPSSILLDAKVLREILFFHDSTPSLGQVKATLSKHIMFILSERY